MQLSIHKKTHRETEAAIISLLVVLRLVYFQWIRIKFNRINLIVFADRIKSNDKPGRIPTVGSSIGDREIGSMRNDKIGCFVYSRLGFNLFSQEKIFSQKLKPT